MVLLPIHIAAGSLAILAGAVALYAAKGARLHRRSGMLFVYSMLVMSATAAVIASLQPNVMNALQGVLTFYLVTTGLLTVRRPGSPWLDRAAFVVALSVGAAQMTFGFQALQSTAGRKFGYPPALFFIFGSLALVAAAGDVRMMLAGRLDGARRLARHLWRMSFAMFIATGSFFLGQAKVIPKPIRIMPLLTLLALAPLLLMIFWLVRVRSKRGLTPSFSGRATG
jgi:hypothetical protein